MEKTPNTIQEQTDNDSLKTKSESLSVENTEQIQKTT